MTIFAAPQLFRLFFWTVVVCTCFLNHGLSCNILKSKIQLIFRTFDSWDTNFHYCHIYLRMTLIYLLLEVRIYNFKWRRIVKRKTLFFIFHRLPFSVWKGLLFILCYYLIMLGRLSKCIVMFCKYFSSWCC